MTAPSFHRLWASLIDGFMVMVIAGALAVIGGEQSSWVLVIGGIYYVVPTVAFGQTLGKRLLNIRVVLMSNRSLLTIGPSVVRWTPIGLGSIAEITDNPSLLGGALVIQIVVYFPVLWSPLRRGLHDRVVGTFVIDEG